MATSVQVSLIRANSEDPNIQNYHDARALRFAYGDRSGIIPNIGEELAASFVADKIHIAPGEVVCQGWQVDVMGAGIDLDVSRPTASGTNYFYTVYLKISLVVSSLQKAEITYARGGSSYIDTPTGDDLSKVKDGTGYLELYRVLVPYMGNATILKRVDTLKYEKEYLDDMNSKIEGYYNYLAMRVDELGFKSGVATYTGFNTTASTNSVRKVGKYILFDFIIGSSSSPAWSTTQVYSTHKITVPTWAKPKQATAITYQIYEIIRFDATVDGSTEVCRANAYISHETNIATDVTIVVKCDGEDTRITRSSGDFKVVRSNVPSGGLVIHCGWEIA